MPKVSVIMLTYNRIQYVRNMIEDILGQNYSDFEYIIVNNGCTDGTENVLKEYALKDSRIKIITLLDGKMIGYARNRGVESSSGEYIAFVDDDDRLKSGFLEFLVNLLEENDADISMCGTTEGDGTTRIPQCIFDEKLILSGEEAVDLLIGRKYIRAGIPTKLYKREILEKYPFVENYKNEDIHTQYKYLLSARVVAMQGLDLYYITRHSNNVSGFTSNPGGWDYQTMKDYMEAYHNRTEFIREHAPNIYGHALYSEWSFMISMIDKIERFNISDCKTLEEDFKKVLVENREKFTNMKYIQNFEIDWMEKYI